ncbi:MAG TPA: lytic transglycosylase domain-containing protein [Streptosporangiaceae bacterium]
MRRLIPHCLVLHGGPRATGSLRRAVGGAAGCSALVLLAAGVLPRTVQPPLGESLTSAVPTPALAATPDPGPFRQIILPDLLVVAPQGITGQDLSELNKITGVRNTIAFDGAEIRAGRRPVSVIGVNPATFRSWVPLRTASDQAFWTDLAEGKFVASRAARTRLGLRAGASYQLTGATRQAVTFGTAASLGIGAVDLLVNMQTSRQLGLVHRVAALISAPGTSLRRLTRQVRNVLGQSAKIVSLRQQQLPVTKATSGQRPSTYLQLFRDSAARYCPGLSWTVLAAIGQIESGDGTNVGPSTAGALGPMQFLPSTWAIWGIDGFGQTGPPDIMNPYDAVPSAARMLCADGAGRGGSALSAAIFDYNHAEWYVKEVLALAAEYARNYPS